MSSPSRIWDLPVRLVHWLMVLLVATSWWTVEYDHMQWHYRSGYALLTLVLFRLIWGLVGSSSARFSQFVRGPTAVWRYTRTLFHRRPSAHAGHNPLGGWSVLVLLGLLLVQIGLGLISEGVDGLTYGALSYLVSYDTARWAAQTHELLFNLLLAFIVLHVAAILFYWFYKRDNLIIPMITGRKSLAETPGIHFRPLWLAALLLALAAIGVALLVT